MINKKIIKEIFSNYSINKVIFIEEKSFNSFIIVSMNESISLTRWENLENILKEYLNKDVTLLPLSQALKALGENHLRKGEIIQ